MAQSVRTCVVRLAVVLRLLFSDNTCKRTLSVSSRLWCGGLTRLGDSFHLSTQDFGTQVFFSKEYKAACRHSRPPQPRGQFVNPRVAEYLAGRLPTSSCFQTPASGIPCDWTKPTLGAVDEVQYDLLFPESRKAWTPASAAGFLYIASRLDATKCCLSSRASVDLS